MTHAKTVITSLLVGAAVAAGAIAAGAVPASGKQLRFDCGTADSPVMAGYQRLTDRDLYTEDKGYGWEGKAPEAEVFEIPPPPPGRGYVGRPPQLTQYFKESLDELNGDAAVSAADLAFRADLPAGRYRVTIVLGDMSQAIGSIDVYINGKLVGDQVSAWTPGAYAVPINNPGGWWSYVRGTVEPRDGVIRVLLKKNQSRYDRELAEQMTWENPYSKNWNWTPSHGDEMYPPWNYIGWPFARNSIMAIEIVPYVPAPVVVSDGKLSLDRPLNNPALAEAISGFNAGDVYAAMSALERVDEANLEALAAKAVVSLWLVGHPQTEQHEEAPLLSGALDTLRRYVSANPRETGIAELIQDAEIFQHARTLHLTRGELGKNHFVENEKAIGWWWLIKEDSPLYYKSQLYIGQAAHMSLPHIPSVGLAKQVFEKLENKFPENRYVKYYLHWEWEPHGDGSHPTDWVMQDYYSKTEGGPQWARLLHEAYATMIDWSEWWIKFKQYPEGTIGGGWGDDVEIVGAFGYLGYLSRGVSEMSVQGTRNLVEGMWHLSEVDPEIGYCLPRADAEHTAEWTGNTLGMMVQIDYGNPIWIERSLKTAKLMRDLWTDYDNHHRRHFRSNFFGAAQVGGGDQANDSWINYRAIRPAVAVLEYNQNPSIAEWFVDMADAWCDAAMSTARGKPRGIIPAQVSFPDRILGGTNSPNWYTAGHPPGTVNYDWAGPKGQDYKAYIQDLLMTAYTHTGDEKYLQPLKSEYELATRYGHEPDVQGGVRLGMAPWLRTMKDTRNGINVLLERWTPPKRRSDEAPQTHAKPEKAVQPTPQKSVPAAEEGSEAWVAGELKAVDAWLAAKRMLEGRAEGLIADITKQQIEDHLLFAREMRKMSWPLMTTQSSPTDRIPIHGLLPVLFTYSGGYFGGPALRVPVTYNNTTKDFAAAVTASDAQGFRILYHSFAADTRDIDVVAWELEPGGKYTLTYGEDRDEDGQRDSVAERREFTFPQMGTPVRVTVRPRITYVIEVDQVERGRAAEEAPDPGLSAKDIRFAGDYGLLLAKVHNVGSRAVRNLKVDFYDGDPKEGGEEIGSAVIPSIEAPNHLEPCAVTVAVNWTPTKESHEIYVVIDPEDEIPDEITTFNNEPHAAVP